MKMVFKGETLILQLYSEIYLHPLIILCFGE